MKKAAEAPKPKSKWRQQSGQLRRAMESARAGRGAYQLAGSSLAQALCGRWRGEAHAPDRTAAQAAVVFAFLLGDAPLPHTHAPALLQSRAFAGAMQPSVRLCAWVCRPLRRNFTSLRLVGRRRRRERGPDGAGSRRRPSGAANCCFSSSYIVCACKHT